MAKVFVGMSGGVDSSVAAALLVEQGHDVTGVYMKNWSRDLPGMRCPWLEDVADAKRVAVSLGIDFRVFDFENQYKQRVVDAMVAEYRAGRTPNPDVMCNQEIKFKLFLETALEQGAEMIATGHYARVDSNSGAVRFSVTPSSKTASRPTALEYLSGADGVADVLENGLPNARLLIARDKDKDQTYFLYRVTKEALTKTLFPLGDYTKTEVRQMAKERGLWTAGKKESMGICFVGQVGIREFLEQYLELVPGEIIDQDSRQVVGRHDGAILYTIGQRHGLNVGGGLPYYVVGKDIAKNLVYVSRDLNNSVIWRDRLTLTDLHWINQPPDGSKNLTVRLRHRGKLIDIIDLETVGSELKIKLAETERAITEGQSAVLYDGRRVVGGGIIAKTD